MRPSAWTGGPAFLIMRRKVPVRDAWPLTIQAGSVGQVRLKFDLWDLPTMAGTRAHRRLYLLLHDNFDFPRIIVIQKFAGGLSSMDRDARSYQRASPMQDRGCCEIRH